MRTERYPSEPPEERYDDHHPPVRHFCRLSSVYIFDHEPQHFHHAKVLITDHHTKAGVSLQKRSATFLDNRHAPIIRR